MEQIFNLVYYMHLSYQEAYNLPIYQRLWFLQRTKKELEAIKAAQDGKGTASNESGSSTPQGLEHPLMQQLKSNVQGNSQVKSSISSQMSKMPPGIRKFHKV